MDGSNFNYREAARAVVLDGMRVALLKVNKHHYFKLPGGGIEDGEDASTGLARETLEEIGCRIKVTSEVGQIVEYRDQWQLRQVSYCYVANKVGDAIPPHFTGEELADGFEIVWAPDIHAAIRLVNETKSDGYEAPFIRRRDALFLEAAKVQLQV
jgi:8-oxo-dGTP diphosphatase